MKKAGNLMVPRTVKQKPKSIPTRSGRGTSGPKTVQSSQTGDRKIKKEVTDRELAEHESRPKTVQSSQIEARKIKKEVTDREVAEHVVTDLVNKTCDSVTSTSQSPVVCASQPSGSTKPSADKAFTERISMQNNKPYVDVGAISHDNKVPVYNRSRISSQKPSHSGANFRSNVAWEPSRRKGRHHQHTHTETGSDRYGKSDVYHPRRWEYTKVGRQYLQRPASSNGGVEFTVMSYNILAQNLLEDNYNLYERSPSHVLVWKHRAALLMKEIKHHSPDVVCLQEVNWSHYEEFFLEEFDQLGYEGEYLKRTGDKQDGCATFYKMRTFVCEEVILVPYLKQNGGALLDRDNVGLIVKLKPKSALKYMDNRRLVVANTHLLFNPKRGDIKLAQLMILLAEIDECAYNPGPRDLYHSVIMCGDFNSEPHSDIYKLIVMGFLEYEGLMTKKISGQVEYGTSKSSGNDHILQRNFFPNSVGINDSCQYKWCIKKRKAQEKKKVKNDDVLEDMQGSGVLKHQLRCLSVYKHWLSDRKTREITTHHGKAACSVDYIFYGVRSGMVRFHEGEVQTNNIQEGNLSLLARYELLSERDLVRMGSLPNTLYGSDHLSLMAKFFLT